MHLRESLLTNHVLDLHERMTMMEESQAKVREAYVIKNSIYFSFRMQIRANKIDLMEANCLFYKSCS